MTREERKLLTAQRRLERQRSEIRRLQAVSSARKRVLRSARPWLAWSNPSIAKRLGAILDGKE